MINKDGYESVECRVSTNSVCFKSRYVFVLETNMAAIINLKRTDIGSTIGDFKKGQELDDRYASYDYCSNYFRPKCGLCITDDMEKSCLALGFYLASWGMYRGSSFLLNKSAHVYVPLIEYLSTLDDSVWEIDAHNLIQNSDKLVDIYGQIRDKLIPTNSSHIVLATKIMMGVLGCVPAYDRFFVSSFREIFKGRCAFSSFNKESLSCIEEFYLANEKDIDFQVSAIKTLSFDGSATGLPYTKAKIIDMYGFTKGLEMSGS